MGRSAFVSTPTVTPLCNAAWRACAIGSLEQAVSCRFQRDTNGWRVFITTQALPFERRSDRRLGAIGIDLNADHLAVCETDRSGNPIAAFSIPLVTYGLDRHQAQARIGEAIKTLMDFARDRGKPLAIEKLDFSAKKAAQEAEGGRDARMLSALAYDRIVATCIQAADKNHREAEMAANYRMAARAASARKPERVAPCALA